MTFSDDLQGQNYFVHLLQVISVFGSYKQTRGKFLVQSHAALDRVSTNFERRAVPLR